MDDQKHYAQASIKTADNLKTIAQSFKARELSHLSLPEIEAVVDQVAKVVPAGNVPGVILNGLARLTGRRPPIKNITRDIKLLFKGVEQALDKAVYSAFFAGPAAVIWGYQNLLKLAGKDPEDAFPDGTWQFYAEYALREDTARHANETHGFDTTLNQHQIRLTPIDRITAWVMTAIYCLHQYNDLLENEWRERTYIRLLCEVTNDLPQNSPYAQLYRQWAKQRPYRRSHEAGDQTYSTYRRVKFSQFLDKATQSLDDKQRREWAEGVANAKNDKLGDYQRQMSILAYLDPDVHNETRTPIPLGKMHIGIIWQRHYYLIPVCAPGSQRPANVHTVRSQIAALMTQACGSPPTQLTPLARLKRSELVKLRKELPPNLLKALDALRLAPILINGDQRPRSLTLSELRQAERGVGDHALTLFDTGETIVFDQSHIFFDGAWGSALAEIMTNEALAWAVYLSQLPPAKPNPTPPYMPTCQLESSELTLIRQLPRSTPEASAETDTVDIKAILALRKLFKQRNDLLKLTVNDILILYRAIHAVTYQFKPDLMNALQKLSQDRSSRVAALTTLQAIKESTQVNPAILIPIDASQRSPRDRLYPTTFEVPLGELDLITLHTQVTKAFAAYNNTSRERSSLYGKFDQLQRIYLATLAGFGEVLHKAKMIALAGESANIGAIKMLANIPPPLQHMLDKVPGQFDVLNDIIKGREVFSNVGAVATNSTLVRFITAKDDNEKKSLAWGVITDAQGVMRISLRDFRPHVRLLQACGHKDLATRITQDYLDSYARGLNRFIRDLQHITRTSRETRMHRPPDPQGVTQ